MMKKKKRRKSKTEQHSFSRSLPFFCLPQPFLTLKFGKSLF